MALIQNILTKIKQARSKPLLRSAAYGAASSGVNTCILLVGNALYVYVLGAEQYGTLAIILSFAQLMQLGNLGLGYGVTKLCREKPELTRQYLYTGLIISIIPVFTIAIAYRFGGTAISGFFGRINGLKAGTAALLALSAFLASLALINDFIGGILNGLGRIEAANNGAVVSKSGSVLLAASFLCFPGFRSYAAVAVASCITGLFAMAYQLWNVSRLAEPGSLIPIWPRSSHYSAIFKASGGVAFGGMVSVLIFPFARLSIASAAGASQVALYDLLIKFSFALRGLFELALRAFIREFAPGKVSIESRRALYKKTNMWIRRISPAFWIVLLLCLDTFIYVFKHRLRLDGSMGVAYGCALAISIATTAKLLNIPSYFWLIANGKTGQVFLSHLLNAIAHILCGIFIVHIAAHFACLSFCIAFALSSVAALIVLEVAAAREPDQTFTSQVAAEPQY
jgi:hypothetical protein